MGITCTYCFMILLLVFLVTSSAPGESLEILSLRASRSVVALHSSVEIECRVSSAEALIWWTLNGGNVSVDREDVSIDRQSDRSVLKIGKSYALDAGQYTCHTVMEDDDDSYCNKSVGLNVFENIRVTTKPIIIARKDEDVQLKCVAIADSTWDGKHLVMVDKPRWIKNGRDMPSYQVSQKLSGERIEVTLTIPRFSVFDEGLYTCKAGFVLNPVTSDTHLIASSSLIPSNVNVKMLNHTTIFHWPQLQLDGVEIQYYALNITYNDQTETFLIDDQHKKDNLGVLYMRQLPLEDTFYTITVRACMLNDICGDFSHPFILAYFKDFEKPEKVIVECRHDNISLESFLFVHWEPPRTPMSLPNSLTYQVKVYGKSHFRTAHGEMRVDMEHQVYTSSLLNWSHRMKSNTNYTVQVCVQTALDCGKPSLQSATTSCGTPPSVPAVIPPLELNNIDALDCDCLQLELPRVSERYGSIQCYQVVLYKLKEGQTEIPDSSTIQISNYNDVHSEKGYGAYVAESFASENFQTKVILGDEKQSQCSNEIVENIDGLRKRRESSDLNGSYVRSRIYDGKLDPGAKYSGFIEVVVNGVSGRELKRRSPMFPSVQIISRGSESAALPTALGVICGLIAIILILIVALCLLRRKSLERMPRDAPILPQPSMKPIKKDQLVAAYLGRHKDSDLVFQREYELLPEYFKDRTSKASDSTDNILKNRYPDIKAYDQSRVKLKGVVGSSGSDYINANYVPGYKNRKKYICAQGPLEKTVNDFWRMIWEQRVEVIAMVTGLEENGKIKCAKYWPDTGEHAYGEIIVSKTEEFHYGDYSIRRFVVKIVQSIDATVIEPLAVTQLHYTAWRDFLAPDRPGGILKFMNRLQEVWKAPYNTSLLVHCSAGVGRSGTLIAIDILLEQLAVEGEINVYQCVSELRRHRNFMVQSLTQYIFIYRAVMEYYQFGCTEIGLGQFPSHLDSLENGERTLLQAEFHKLDEVVEDHKSTDVGSIEPNTSKNRYDYILPFDKNRIVLTSIPNVESPTYINASAVMGCDRSTAFILTQDPLENTIGDFWRMIYEQHVVVIVMLSTSVGNSSKEQCPVYWPEVEQPLVYKHISVCQTENEEELDNRVKRKFTVTNTISSKEVTVTHFQYKNWTSSLPENQTEIIKLVEAVWKAVADEGRKDPIVVHCSNGGERSSLFAAVSILMEQAKKEGRVDVFHTVCNLRSERQTVVPTLDHYHFCYKIILEYAKTV
ncbi:hypothetical protein CHUAL_011614 [Chamberlinius hualienensis]